MSEVRELEVLARQIEQDIVDLQRWISEGTLPSYDAYKSATGRIAGLQIALKKVRDLIDPTRKG